MAWSNRASMHDRQCYLTTVVVPLTRERYKQTLPMAYHESEIDEHVYRCKRTRFIPVNRRPALPSARRLIRFMKGLVTLTREGERNDGRLISSLRLHSGRTTSRTAMELD